MKCLFAIGGDPVRSSEGAVRIRRLVGDEIISREAPPHMLFSQISLRRSSEADDAPVSVVPPRRAGRYVQQFKFLRLSPEINYEPVALALMGVQLALSPGSFMTAAQYEAHRQHRKLYHDLLDWGGSPTAVRQEELEAFLGYVYDGLTRAGPIHAGHHEAYLAWALSELRDTVKAFNAMLAAPAPPPATTKPG